MSSGHLMQSFLTATCWLCLLCNLLQDSLPINCTESLEPKGNSTFPSCLKPLYQSEAWCTTIHMKMSLIHMWMKSHFHMKRWAPRLALRKRLKVIRKWPINLLRQLQLHKQRFHAVYWLSKLSAQPIKEAKPARAICLNMGTLPCLFHGVICLQEKVNNHHLRNGWQQHDREKDRSRRKPSVVVPRWRFWSRAVWRQPAWNHQVWSTSNLWMTQTVLECLTSEISNS